MNIDDVLGIIVDVDGKPHPFGKSKKDPLQKLTDENFHDKAFLKEIYPSSWFQNTGYKYDERQNIVYHLQEMATHGFTVILNGSSVSQYGDDYYLYTITTQEKPTDEVKEFFKEFYPVIKELQERTNALFFGEAYDESSTMIWKEPVYDIDEFYEKLSLPKKNSKIR